MQLFENLESEGATNRNIKKITFKFLHLFLRLCCIQSYK